MEPAAGKPSSDSINTLSVNLNSDVSFAGVYNSGNTGFAYLDHLRVSTVNIVFEVRWSRRKVDLWEGDVSTLIYGLLEVQPLHCLQLFLNNKFPVCLFDFDLACAEQGRKKPWTCSTLHLKEHQGGLPLRPTCYKGHQREWEMTKTH